MNNRNSETDVITKLQTCKLVLSCQEDSVLYLEHSARFPSITVVC